MPILRTVLGAVVAGDPKQSWVEVDFVWKAVLRGLGHFLFLAKSSVYRVSRHQATE